MQHQKYNHLKEIPTIIQRIEENEIFLLSWLNLSFVWKSETKKLEKGTKRDKSHSHTTRPNKTSFIHNIHHNSRKAVVRASFPNWNKAVSKKQNVHFSVKEKLNAEKGYLVVMLDDKEDNTIKHTTARERAGRQLNPVSQ